MSRKKLFFIFIPLILLLISTELCLRFIYFQINNNDTCAIISIIKYGRKFLEKKRVAVRRREAVKWVENLQRKLGIPLKLIFESLFAPRGRKLLAEFKKKYEDNFKILLTETNKIGSKLIVLYIPKGNFNSPMRIHRRIICQKFYSNLAKKYNIEFVDSTPEFLKYSPYVVTLLPEDSHLSRFGNKLLVRKLSKYIDKYNNYKSTFKFNEKPKFFGDLIPSYNGFYTIAENMPFWLVTNKQGLRLDWNITFPKKKQRILVLGDSYTFGPYLPNYHTYSNLLNKKYPDKEVINAGVYGYTIADEASLFVERAKYVEPDIVILQVVDNDLSGFFYFLLNIHGREKNVHIPSDLEKELLNNLKKVKKH